MHDFITFLGYIISASGGVIATRLMQKAPDKTADLELINGLKKQLDDISKRDERIVKLEREITELNHTIVLLKEEIQDLKKGGDGHV